MIQVLQVNLNCHILHLSTTILLTSVFKTLIVYNQQTTLCTLRRDFVNWDLSNEILKSIFFFYYWVDLPCNTVHVHQIRDSRYFSVVYSTFVTHTSSVPTLKVHYCTPYILRHYCFCSLFTLLTAALPQYCLAQPEAVCLSVHPSWRL